MRRDITRRSAVLVLLLAGLILVAQAQELRLPNKEGSLKFAVIGDSGHPGTGQTAVARQMASWRTRFPFEFALMTGDNLYGTESPRDYENKFSIPYKPLIDAGVKFYAALGNHDDDGQTQYKLFNMDGKKYYSFKPQTRRAILRDRHQLCGRQAAGMARQGAGGQRIRLEDCLLPPPAVLLRRHARLR